MLLKHITDEEGIAPRLVASADELEAIAIDDNAPIRAQTGWRHDVWRGGPATKAWENRPCRKWPPYQDD